MSNNLNLSQVAASQNQKEVTINDQAGELDAALTEQFEADVSSGNVALTAAQYRRAVHIKATGAATAGRTVTLQAIKKLSVISNLSTTDSVDFILGSATIALDPAADAASPTMALVYTDGTADGLFAVSSGVGGGGGGSTNADYAFYFPGAYSAGAIMARIEVGRDFTLPIGLTGSQASAGTAATGSTVLDIYKNGSPIATVTFSAAGTTGSFSMAGAVGFVAGDLLEILNEDPADATLADVSVTLVGTLD
jgi:hypothetical protein